MEPKVWLPFPSSGHPASVFTRNLSWILFLVISVFAASFVSPSVPTSCGGWALCPPAASSCSLVAVGFPGES
eukprot:13380496-Heterocapsa_arctica.AAC.1